MTYFVETFKMFVILGVTLLADLNIWYCIQPRLMELDSTQLGTAGISPIAMSSSVFNSDL